MKTKSYIIGLTILLTAIVNNNLLGCGDYFPPSESNGGWRKNTSKQFIQSLGFIPEKLEEFGQYNLSIPNSNWKPYSDYKGVLVIKDGWIVGEWYNTKEGYKEFKGKLF